MQGAWDDAYLGKEVRLLVSKTGVSKYKKNLKIDKIGSILGFDILFWKLLWL